MSKAAADFWAEMKADEAKKASKVDIMWNSLKNEQEKRVPQRIASIAVKSPSSPAPASSSSSASVSSPAPAAASASQPSEASTVDTQNIRRDINFLSDPERRTRQKGLENLRLRLLTADGSSLREGGLDIIPEVLKPILKLFSDSVEKCRELAVKLLCDLLPFIPDLNIQLPLIIPTLVARTLTTVSGGTQIPVETSEETRLALLTATTRVAKLSGKKIQSYIDDYCQILLRGFVDNFAEVRRESFVCVGELAAVSPEGLRMISETLVKQVRLSFGHQHSKVRLVAVRALGTLISNGGDKQLEDVRDNLKTLALDNSAQVREAVVDVCGHWANTLLDRWNYSPWLIPVLLAGLSDEMPNIQNLALSWINKLGLQYEEDKEEELRDLRAYGFEDLSPTLPHVSTAHVPSPLEQGKRPPLGARFYLREFMGKLIKPMLEAMSDWSVKVRLSAVGSLRRLQVFAEEYMLQHLNDIVQTLFKCIKDDEPVVAKEVSLCAELIGRYIEPAGYLPLIGPHALGVTNPGPAFRVCVMTVFSHILLGTPATRLVSPKLNEIVSILRAPELCGCDHTELKFQLVSCIKSLVIASSAENIKTVSRDLFASLLTVLATSTASPDLCKAAHDALTQLATQQGLESSVALFSLHFSSVLDSILPSHSSWTRQTPDFLMFDLLMRKSGDAIGRHWDRLYPVLSEHLHPTQDPGLRLTILALLNNTMADDLTRASLQPHIHQIVGEMLIPNAIWRAGRAAAAVRKAAVACTSVILRQRMLEPSTAAVMPALLPVLISSMDDDYDVETRMISCLCMRDALSAARSIPEENRHNLHFELLKRMDDSNDEVRIKTTSIISAFAAAVSAMKLGYEEYKAHELMKGLLVHLDDSNASVQAAVLQACKDTAVLSPSAAIEEATAVRDKHRSPRFCDELVEHAKTLPPPPPVVYNHSQPSGSSDVNMDSH